MSWQKRVLAGGVGVGGDAPKITSARQDCGASGPLPRRDEAAVRERRDSTPSLMRPTASSALRYGAASGGPGAGGIGSGAGEHATAAMDRDKRASSTSRRVQVGDTHGAEDGLGNSRLDSARGYGGQGPGQGPPPRSKSAVRVGRK